MLSAHAKWAAAVLVSLFLIPIPFARAASASGGGVVCDPRGICKVGTGHGSHGGSGGHGGRGGGPTGTCKSGTEVVPCHDPAFGWWNPSAGCYYLAVSPWPSVGEVSAWQLPWHQLGDGSYYGVNCLGVRGTATGMTWLAKPPPGYGGVNVWALTQRALRLLRMAKPDIVMSPPLGKPSIVGVYDWLWIARTPFSWGRQSVMAAVPGASVTATAVALQVVWNMGDGTAITCLTPGTPWVAGDPGNAPSDCSYAYRQRGAFRVTATTTFQVAWAGTGLAASAKGRMQIHLSSSAPVTVDELQAINTVR